MSVDPAPPRASAGSRPAAVQGVAARAVPTRGVVLALVAEVLLALVLGFVRLRHRPLWLDESFTWSTVDRPFGDLLWVLAFREGFQALHALLVWPVNQVSSTVAALRAPSVLAFAGTVPAAWWAGRRLADDRVGLLAGLLVAVNGFALRYAQEARSYALATLLVTLAAAGLAAEVLGPTRRSRALWIAASVLAVYAHGWAVLSVAALVGSLVLLPGPLLRARRLLTGAAWIGALVAPALALSVYQIRFGDDFSWVDRPGLSALWGTVGDLSGLTATMVPVYVVAVAVVLAGLVGALRRDGRGPEAWRGGMLLSWALVPSAALLASSQVDPLFIDRYVVMSTGGVALLGAWAVARLRSPRVRAVAVVVVVALASRGVVASYDTTLHDRVDLLVADLSARVEPGDAVVVVVDQTRLALEFHARGTRMEALGEPIFPAAPWGEFRVPDQSQSGVFWGPDLEARLEAGAWPTVWVLAAYHDAPRLRTRINRLAFGYEIVDQRVTSRGDTLVHLEHRV